MDSFMLNPGTEKALEEMKIINDVFFFFFFLLFNS